MIGHNADWKDPKQVPKAHSKAANLEVINERRSRQQRMLNSSLFLADSSDSLASAAKNNYPRTATHQEFYDQSPLLRSTDGLSSGKYKNIGNVNAFNLKQRERQSHVFEQTDYSHFEPLGQQRVDMNNLKRSQSAQRLYSTNRFGGGSKDGYNTTRISPAKKPPRELLASSGNFLDSDVKA